MSRRRFFQVLVTTIVAVCILAFSGILSAQGNNGIGFERAREVQERHTEELMARPGIVGTAVGLDGTGSHAVFVLLERPGVAGIPQELDGVRVRAVVTGEIRALARPSGKPGKDRTPPAKPGKDRTPPSPPTGLMATANSSSQINLDWADNDDSDFSSYRVYRATASGGPYSRIASGLAESDYSNTGLTPETTYYYYVTAVDTSGNESGYSNQASATTSAGSTDSPFPRPALIGISTGHPNITAGTIGCRVKDSDGNVYALSNNHVYADENRASFGDNVLQPGPYDGGLNPRDAIGTLSDFEPIVFSRRAYNVIDAAIALSSTAMLDNKTSIDDGYGPPDSDPAENVALGLTVKKHGRTTGLTHGQVYMLNATVNVGYDSGTARFVNQIVITPGTFSAGGDSGSLIVTEDGEQPVGLLFAGSTSYTIANPIGAVLDRFSVTVDGK